ncbi:MAG TPA: hypothetical protein VK537_07630 [Galbitalea sp.]|nr:hypothetical protein [Galbitalea sp.]
MGDALMAMFWAGLAAGFAIGLGVAGLIAAVWWFWPQHDEIGPDTEFRVVADYPDHVPVEWETDDA